MTGVSAFLFFFHKHTIITIKDATLMSQSFTSMDARTQPRIIPCTNGIGLYEIDETHETFDTLQEAKEALEKLKDVPTYPEPDGEPSY